DVGDEEDVLAIQDAIGFGGDGSVSRFADDSRVNSVGILFGNGVFERGRDEDFAIEGEQVFRRDADGVGESFEAAGAGFVSDDGGDVEAVGVVDASGGIADGEDSGSGFVEELGGDGSGITESLDDDAGAHYGNAEVFATAEGGVEDAAGGGFI